MSELDLRRFVRDVPDFPKPGILFRDVTPLLADGGALRESIRQLTRVIATFRPTVLVGIESRGFIFGAAAAVELGLGLVPMRKPGKLPWRTRQLRYDLEYGTDALEAHEDAFPQGSRVVVVDDVLATGGTAAASIRLVRELGGEVVGTAFVIELAALGGRERLLGVPAQSLLSY